MPSKERFQTRPMGRAFKRRLLSRNFLFRGRQQPKLRKLDVVCFWSGFYPSLTIQTQNPGGDNITLPHLRAPACASHLAHKI
jgi:hypothetical protein